MKLNAHQGYGLLLVALGAAQANLGSIQSVVSQHTFSWLTMGIGVSVAALGFLVKPSQ